MNLVTTSEEDTLGTEKLEEALEEAYEAGTQQEFYDWVEVADDLWSELLAVLGATT